MSEPKNGLVITRSQQTALTDYLIVNVQGKPALQQANAAFFEGDMPLDERADRIKGSLCREVETCFNTAIILAACFKLDLTLVTRVLFLLRDALMRPAEAKHNLYQGTVFGVLQGVLFVPDEHEPSIRAKILQLLKALLVLHVQDLPNKIAPQHMQGLHEHLGGALSNIALELVQRRRALITEFRVAVKNSLGNTHPLLDFESLVGVTHDILREFELKEEGELTAVDRLNRNIEWPPKADAKAKE